MTPSVPPLSAPTTLAMAQQPHPGTAAQALLVEAAACWFGGLWGDVQGDGPAQRKESAAKRCASLVRDVFGHDDKTRYEQVRALDAETVQEVAAKLAALASADPVDAPRKDALVTVLRALADAQKETMVARRAGKRVLRDFEREPEKLSSDEAAALPELEAASAFAALDHADVGDLRKEAHVFTVLVTLDRMNIAQEIPLHLKPYPVVAPFKAVFGAPVPELPHDASKPLPGAGWLTYLTTVAAAAGHPVADTSASPQVRHERAVQGILAGLSDKLKTDAEGIPAGAALARFVQQVVMDLDAVAKPATKAPAGG